MIRVRPNVVALEVAIEAYRRTQRESVTYEEIAARTARVSGPTVALKTFQNIRMGSRTTYERLASIAAVLKVDVDTLIVDESASSALVPLEKDQQQLDVLDEVVQALVDALINGMVSQLGPDQKSEEEFYSEISRKILSGALSSEVQSSDAKQFFAGMRNPERELRFERNIRRIAEKTLPFLRNVSSIEKLPDQTWLDTYTSFAEKISDEELQTLWGQVLAREFTAAGSISLKTLRVLQDLTKRQALLFTKLCGSVVIVSDDRTGSDDTSYLSIRLDGSTDTYLRMSGLEFHDLVELSDFDLVNFGTRGFEADAGAWFTYFDQQFQVTEKVAFKCNPLSTVGRELFQLARRQKSDVYYEAVKSLFKGKIGPDVEVPSTFEPS